MEVQLYFIYVVFVQCLFFLPLFQRETIVVTSCLLPLQRISFKVGLLSKKVKMAESMKMYLDLLDRKKYKK